MIRRPLLAALPLVLVGAAACGDDDGDAAADPVRNERLAEVSSFALALGVDLDVPEVAEQLGRFDLVVIDGVDPPDGLVDALHDDGTLVLGYLSVGTIEEGRPWSAAAEAHELDFWEDWGEYYADVADAGFRSIILDDAAPLVLDAGFDGLFLDNVDMVESHPDQAHGMETLVAALDDALGDRLLFAQNGDDSVDRVAAHLDGWNREDVTSIGDPLDEGSYELVDAESTASAVATLERLRGEGLLVTTTDYVADGDTATTADAVARSCAAGALPYVADIALTRLPDPRTC